MTNTINQQPAAVSLQLTDELLLWQSGQSPPTRNLPVSGLNVYYARLTGAAFTGPISVSSGGFTVTGNSTITGTLTTSGGFTVSGGGIAITGNGTFSGAVTAGTGLTVTTGGAAVTGTLAVTGAATVSTTLGVTGAATLSSTLGVAGAATFNSTGAFTGAVTAANGTSGSQVVNFSQFSQILGNSGTITLPGGLIIKWGQGTAPSTGTSTTNIAVTFPSAFPNAIYHGYATPNGPSNSIAGGVPSVMITPASASAMTINLDTLGYTTIDQNIAVSWLALGN